MEYKTYDVAFVFGVIFCTHCWQIFLIWNSDRSWLIKFWKDDKLNVLQKGLISQQTPLWKDERSTWRHCGTYGQHHSWEGERRRNWEEWCGKFAGRLYKFVIGSFIRAEIQTIFQFDECAMQEILINLYKEEAHSMPATTKRSNQLWGHFKRRLWLILLIR